MIEVEHRTKSWPLLSGFLLVGLIAGEGVAQGPASSRTFTPESSYSAVTQLRRAADQAQQGQWAESIELYQKIIGQYANAMTEVPKGEAIADGKGESKLFVDARYYAQTRLAKLPAEALTLYRARVDAQAERLYQQGKMQRDCAALRKVIDQFFCSSWGDDALELLGDLSFQEGQFGEALGFYRRLVPDDPASVAGLVYIDAQVDPARVAAKKILCRECAGVDTPTATDLRAYASAYPGARGAACRARRRVRQDAGRGDRRRSPPGTLARGQSLAHVRRCRVAVSDRASAD